MSWSQPPPRSADEALASIDADIAAAQQRAATAVQFRRDLDALRGTGTVGSVSASVDATGLLVDLELPHTLGQQSGDRLRSDILSAVRAAQADVAGQVRGQAVAAFGEGSPIAERVIAEADGRLIR